jgi:mutator protein MutT
MQEVNSLKKVTRIGVYAVARRMGTILLTTKGGGCYNGLLDLPGGGIEFGETIEIALRREFQEEVAMTFSTMKFMNNFTCMNHFPNLADPFSFHQIGLVYEVTGFETIPDAIGEDEFAWYSVEQLQLHELTPFAKNIIQLLQKAL